MALKFTADVDGIVTDPNATVRVQGPRVRGVLIRGTGKTNGKTGIKLQPGSYTDPSYRKVGLAVIEDTYIEHFGTGVDFSKCDSCTFDLGHASDVLVGFLRGQSEIRVSRSALWKIDDEVWRVTGTDSIAPWFQDNEVEPESASCVVLERNNVRRGIVEGNNGRRHRHVREADGKRMQRKPDHRQRAADIRRLDGRARHGHDPLRHRDRREHRGC